MHTTLISSDYRESRIEIIERKGLGHPDTLADHLAEHLSREYSSHCLKRFGAVLHHNFDKLCLLGGSSHVELGRGFLTSPIRVVINGRATRAFGSHELPLESLMTKWTNAFFSTRLPHISPKKDLRFLFEISTQSSPGKVASSAGSGGARSRWFSPQSLADLPELKRLHSNDTSAGIGYAPLSKLENAVLKTETFLNTTLLKRHAWMGSDIKIMAFKDGSRHSVTLCVPQIASHVRSIDEYKKNKHSILSAVQRSLQRHGIPKPEVFLNTRDQEDIPELYLTAIGTSLESGDEGVVGRGNRMNGLITLQRGMSMEGASGKNPVYHIGKLYNLCAQRIADALYADLRTPCEVSLVSQSGRDLLDPWCVAVRLSKSLSATQRRRVDAIIQTQLKALPHITSWLVTASRQLA